jgi:hypothetical protein
VTILKISLTFWENHKIKKSTKICPLSHEVRGMENPITTAPAKATTSYVPGTGLLKPLKITSVMVKSMRNVRLIPAMILKNRLIPFIVFKNTPMDYSSLIFDSAYDKKGEGMLPLPLYLIYF